MLRLLIVVLSMLAFSTEVFAADFRRHFTVKNGEAVLQITEIKDLSEEAHKTHWLVRDTEGRDFVVSESINFTIQKSEYEVRDLQRKSFIRVSFDRPYKAKTRSETLASEPEVENVVSLKYEAGDAVIFASEAELGELERADRLTAQLRRNMDPHLLDAIERMAALWKVETFAAVSAILINPALRYHECLPAAGSEARAKPDCDFDGSFGVEFRCSAASKAKISEAAANGSAITYY